jgi:hypothetical protein
MAVLLLAFPEDGEVKYRHILANHMPQEAWDKEAKIPKANGFTDGTWGTKADRFKGMMNCVGEMYKLLEDEAQRRASEPATEAAE